MKSTLSIFSFLMCVSSVIAEKLLPRILYFLLRASCLLDVHSINFVYSLSKGSHFIFCHMNFLFTQQEFFGLGESFPHWIILGPLPKNDLSVCMRFIFFLQASIQFHVSVSAFNPVLHCFGYSSFVVSLQSGHVKKSDSFHFHDCLNIGGPLRFSVTILGCIFFICVKTSLEL